MRFPWRKDEPRPPAFDALDRLEAAVQEAADLIPIVRAAVKETQQ